MDDCLIVCLSTDYLHGHLNILRHGSLQLLEGNLFVGPVGVPDGPGTADGLVGKVGQVRGVAAEGGRRGRQAFQRQVARRRVPEADAFGDQ